MDPYGFLTEDKKLGKRAKEIFVSCEKKRVDLEFKKVLEKIENSLLNY